MGNIELTHNLEPNAFKWLWAKYVCETNLTKHCQACLKGTQIKDDKGRGTPYSQLFSKASNPEMLNMKTLILSEIDNGDFKAIYLCGVVSKGYSVKKNYPHNLHAAIVPKIGTSDVYSFEKWKLEVKNGFFTKIPEESELPMKYKSLPDAYTTCRIFRWACCIFPLLNEKSKTSEYALN
tara:strand:- start:1128 stop:1664 length:537 start_codon:yes stop_codon:yes gene_type:complete